MPDVPDLVVGGQVIDKSRPSIEPQVYPTAKIIGDLSIVSGTNSVVRTNGGSDTNFTTATFLRLGDT